LLLSGTACWVSVLPHHILFPWGDALPCFWFTCMLFLVIWWIPATCLSNEPLETHIFSAVSLEHVWWKENSRTKGIRLKLGFENNFKALFRVGYFRARMMGWFWCALVNRVIMCLLVFCPEHSKDSLLCLSCLLNILRVGDSAGEGYNGCLKGKSLNEGWVLM
jgi:hypothetical protein